MIALLCRTVLKNIKDSLIYFMQILNRDKQNGKAKLCVLIFNILCLMNKREKEKRKLLIREIVPKNII